MIFCLTGTLFSWALKFYGTLEDPMAMNRIISSTLTPTTKRNTAKPTSQTSSKSLTSPNGLNSGTLSCKICFLQT